MITIELNIGTILTAIIPAAISTIISVLATWFFSKRYYTRESSSRERPVTEYEATNQTMISILRITATTVTIMVITTTLITGLFLLIVGLQ